MRFDIKKKPSVNPQRVNCGHMTSSKVTIHFWLIAFDRTLYRLQNSTIAFLSSIRIECYATWSIWVRSWPLPEVKFHISFLTFLSHIIHHSTRLEELNTMVVKSLTKIFGVQSYDRKTKSSKFGHFDLSWPLETKPFSWGQIWEHNTEGSGKGLSNAFFAPS